MGFETVSIVREQPRFTANLPVNEQIFKKGNVKKGESTIKGALYLFGYYDYAIGSS